MFLYGLTLFLSAFLMFVVQPLLGKLLLPHFGGAPAVWTACMLFYQVLLLAGYSYAHFLAGLKTVRIQAPVHLLLLAGSLIALAGMFSGVPVVAGERGPAIAVMGMLAVLNGFPYFLLASSSPLLQAWFCRISPGISPYRLYSLSNAGSLMAILSYPLVIEPKLPLRTQKLFWCAGYAIFVLVCALCAWRALGSPYTAHPAEGTGGPESSREEEKPQRAQRALWVLLPACSALLMLATTNQLCQDVAVVPLLWILPLGLYLLTFILCFDSPRWYSRTIFGTAYAAALIWTCHVLFQDVFVDLKYQIISASLTLFAACMICHGELARMKPGARHLTIFYGSIAAGGALGGIAAAFVAPAVFRGYWEYHFGLLSTALLFLMVLFVDRGSRLFRGRPLAGWACLVTAVLVLAIVLVMHIRLVTAYDVERTRNFFGVLRVIEDEKGDPRHDRLTLMHGRIQHGCQYLTAFRRNWPTTYYSAASGIGMALRYHPARGHDLSKPGSLRIGVIGLGTGTLAAYGLKGDYIRFYEINPEVIRIALRYFSFLKNSGATVQIVPGDARVTLQREIMKGEFQRFDVLAVDAFSGDAIPVHLLTRECFKIYRAHLKPEGIIALHVSSRYFDLVPVSRALAEEYALKGMQAIQISCPPNQSEGVHASDWVLLTSNREFLNTGKIQEMIRPWASMDPVPPPWTDDYSNLFHFLRRQK